MKDVKILRLVNNEDVVAMVTQIDKSYLLEHPMSVYISYDEDYDERNLNLHHWLPLSIVDDNKTVVSSKNVLAVFEVNESFREYYLNIINDTLSETDLMDSEESETLKLMLELNDAKASKKIH